MEDLVRIFKVNQGLGEDSSALTSNIHRNDLCFFRFSGGNVSETDALVRELYELKETGVFLIGIFRFPFRFEGKRRLQTAIMQYHQMKELCDAMTYIHADGMLEILGEEVSLEDAYQSFEWLEDGPMRSIEELIDIPGQMNIDVHDIRTFLTNSGGAFYIRTFEGETFDEPLKYVLNAPYLPTDYTEGQQIIMNIGCSRDVQMTSFQQINLRLNDLFHKCELFKLGTYFLDEPGNRFRITLIVNGIKDPYPRPQTFRGFKWQRLWLRQRLAAVSQRGRHLVDMTRIKQPTSERGTLEHQEIHS